MRKCNEAAALYWLKHTETCTKPSHSTSDKGFSIHKIYYYQDDNMLIIALFQQRTHKKMKWEHVKI